MPHSKLISVIIPLYNAQKYIAEAIQSVIKQTYTNYEIIVVNDGSTDNSLSAIKSFTQKIKLFNQLHLGAAAARNLGVKNAKGDLIAFLDADDLWVKEKLQWQVDFMKDNHEIDICFGNISSFISPELDNETKNKIYCPSEPISGFLPITMMVKRESFNRIGPFDTQWTLGEFIDWYAKAKILGLKSIKLEKTVALRRLHTTNLGIRERDSRKDYLKIVKTALERKKQLSKEE